MSITKLIQAGWLLAVSAALFGVGAALAQTASPPSSMKTIGMHSAAKPELVQSLIVMNSHGATLRSTS